MKAKPRPILQLLEKGDATQSLMRQLQQQRRLLSVVRKCLPPNLARRCLDARPNGSVLTLFAESPVWASKLRFSAPRLLGDVRQSMPGIASISVRIFPQQGSAAKAQRHRPRQSPIAATSVDGSARDIHDADLRNALLRLADTLRRPDRSR
jgi:hypothetical protein